MAYTTTTLSAACAITDTAISLTALTSVVIGNRIIVDQEEMQVAKGFIAGANPVPVLRGQNGTATAAHASGAAVAQGIGAADFISPAGTGRATDPLRIVNIENSNVVTATGATGTTATMLTSVTPCLVLVAGVSGAGVQVPSGAAMPGNWYLIKHASTGAINIYALGGTVNGVAGATGTAITATGNKTGLLWCAAAGAWELSFNT